MGAGLRAFIGLLFFSVVSPVLGQVEPIRWEPILRFANEFFPSFVLANATRKSNQTVPGIYGDRLGSVGVKVVSPSDGARVRVVASIDGIARDGEIEAVLPERGKQYILIPALRYDYPALLRMVQPSTTTVQYQVFLDGVQVANESRPVRVRSVNDAPIATFEGGKQTGQYEYMFAAYVNENNPAIEYILRGALQLPQPVVRSFEGYAGDVMAQVFAVWYFLQRSGFAYTTITTPSSMGQGVVSQHVRFIDDSIRVRQSNCIDGTVLFASILRKIGIDPAIVLIPGHAFLGFYLDAQHKQVAFLETTLMTATNPFSNRPPSRIGTALARAVQLDTRLAPSAKAFDYAVDFGHQEFEKARASITNHQPGYTVLDVAVLRQSGLQAISR